MSDDDPRIISRRDILRRAGMVGAAAAAVPIALRDSAVAAPAPGAATQAAMPAMTPATTAAATHAAPAREAFENLTAAEAELLEAIVDRLVPSDEHGPGAREARAAHYIDRALGSALASSRQTYAAGLSALDRYATSSRGKSFLALSNTDKDSVLIDVETGTATGFPGNPAQFFTLVLNHTRQGMFGDPYYGGNANFIGWDLLGYPGVRTMVTPADQQALEAHTLKPNHRSAYDFESFNKATAALHDHDHEDMSHGD